MTKLIAFVLAASLCIGSVSAIDVYEVDQDSRPLMMMANSGVSTAAVDDDWYDYVLQNLEWMMFDIDSIEDLVDSIYLDTGDMCEFLFDILEVLGTNMDGSIAAMLSSTLEYIADTAGWLGVYDGGLQLNEFLSLFNASFNSLGADLSALTSFLTLSEFISYVPSGISILGSTGSVVAAKSNVPFLNFFNQAFRGFHTILTTKEEFYDYVPATVSILSSSGSSFSATSDVKPLNFFNQAFRGLSSNLKAISSGSYSLSLFDSDSATQSSAAASTMGVMLQQYLDFMQDDLGALTFIHADSEAVQAKKDAANNTVAVTDSFLKPGSAGSVGVSDIGDAAEAVSGTKDLFDTGVSIGQAFDQLQGSGPLEFFTSVTASNLNTVPATYSDDDDFVHFYDPSNSEFFELIGKGGD